MDIDKEIEKIHKQMCDEYLNRRDDIIAVYKNNLPVYLPRCSVED